MGPEIPGEYPQCKDMKMREIEKYHVTYKKQVMQSI